MISFGVVEEVKRLLAEGVLSQRKIARQLGVSRGTVNAIARGKRPDYKPRQEQKDGVVAPSGRPGRCPMCGGMVRMPCLACRVRAIQESRRRPAPRFRRVGEGRRAAKEANPAPGGARPTASSGPIVPG